LKKHLSKETNVTDVDNPRKTLEIIMHTLAIVPLQFGDRPGYMQAMAHFGQGLRLLGATEEDLADLSDQAAGYVARAFRDGYTPAMKEALENAMQASAQSQWGKEDD
jgi:hypothetical protein